MMPLCSMMAGYLSLAALYDDELLLGRGPGKDYLRVVPQDVIQLLGAEVLQVSAMDNASLGVPGGMGDSARRHYTKGTDVLL